MEYTGELANRYTALSIKLNDLWDNGLREYSSALFHSTHFGEDSPKNDDQITELKEDYVSLNLKKIEIEEAIEKELGVKIKNIGWKRLPSGAFDLSIPSTLIIT